MGRLEDRAAITLDISPITYEWKVSWMGVGSNYWTAGWVVGETESGGLSR